MAKKDQYSAELFERREVSPSLAVFRFRAAERPSFTAGQFATIGVVVDGEVFERPYSIVSSPYEPFLEFFVELVPGGDLTPKLWELKLGSRILIRRRVVGQLTLTPNVRRHLMLATVTGVAPFVSILRTQQIERRRGKVSDDQFLSFKARVALQTLALIKANLRSCHKRDHLSTSPPSAGRGKNRTGRARPDGSRISCANTLTRLE